MIRIGSLDQHNVYDYSAAQLLLHYAALLAQLLSCPVDQFGAIANDLRRVSTDMVARGLIPTIRTRVHGI